MWIHHRQKIIGQGEADCRGVVLTDCAHKGQTSTGAYYWYLLMRLWEAVKMKLTKGVILFHDNAQLILHRIESHMLLLWSIKLCLTLHILLTWHPVTSSSFLRWRNHCVAGIPDWWRADFRGGTFSEQPKCKVLQPRSLPSHPLLRKMCHIEGWIRRVSWSQLDFFKVIIKTCKPYLL